MVKISEHFTVKEFECHCGCGQLIIKKQLVEMAEKFRSFLCMKYGKDVKMEVHCVNRCVDYNNSLPGASINSTHVHGRAMDFHCIGIDYKELRESVMECHGRDNILFGGVGYYPGWGEKTYKGGIHIDISSYRWWGNRDE